MYATDELYSLRQAAAFLGVPEPVVQRMIQSGQIRAWSLPSNRTMLVRKRDLLPFLDPDGELPLPRQLPLFGEPRTRHVA